jgi:hypothetical protein
MAHYRGLISVVITAESDDDAMEIGGKYANLIFESPSDGVVGHLEMLGEVREQSLRITRIVHADPLLLRQLPLDWKP